MTWYCFVIPLYVCKYICTKLPFNSIQNASYPNDKIQFSFVLEKYRKKIKPEYHFISNILITFRECIINFQPQQVSLTQTYTKAGLSSIRCNATSKCIREMYAYEWKKIQRKVHLENSSVVPVSPWASPPELNQTKVRRQHKICNRYTDAVALGYRKMA